MHTVDDYTKADNESDIYSLISELYANTPLDSRGGYEQNRYKGVVKLLSKTYIQPDYETEKHCMKSLKDNNMCSVYIHNDLSMSCNSTFPAKAAVIAPYTSVNAFFEKEKNRRELCAFVVHINDYKINDRFSSVIRTLKNKQMPDPTYITFNRNTANLIYILEYSVPMMGQNAFNIYKQITVLGDGFVEKTPQGFCRYATASLDKYTVCDIDRIYKTGAVVSISTLNNGIFKLCPITARHYKNRVNIETAKTLYPEWYEKHVNKKLVSYSGRPCWTNGISLYKWAIRFALDNISNLQQLCHFITIFGIKCDVDPKCIEKDIAHCFLLLDACPDEHLIQKEVSRGLSQYDSYKRVGIEYLNKAFNLCLTKNLNRKKYGSVEAFAAARKNAAENLRKTNPDSLGCLAKKIYDFKKSHGTYSRKQVADAMHISYSCVCKWWNRVENIYNDLSEKRNKRKKTKVLPHRTKKHCRRSHYKATNQDFAGVKKAFRKEQYAHKAEDRGHICSGCGTYIPAWKINKNKFRAILSYDPNGNHKYGPTIFVCEHCKNKAVV